MSVIQFPINNDRVQETQPEAPWDPTNVIPFDPDRLTQEEEAYNLYMLGF